MIYFWCEKYIQELYLLFERQSKYIVFRLRWCHGPLAKKAYLLRSWLPDPFDGDADDVQAAQSRSWRIKGASLRASDLQASDQFNVHFMTGLDAYEPGFQTKWVKADQSQIAY